MFSTRALSYWHPARRYLEHWNRTQPAPPPWDFTQVDFVDFACTCITLHEFISHPGPCRGSSVTFFFVSSSKGLVAWYNPWWVDGVHWTTPFCLDFFLQPKSGIFSSEVSKNSQNSTISVNPWVAESNPFMSSSFCCSWGSKNSTISRIKFSVKLWFALNKGKISRYLTI